MTTVALLALLACSGGEDTPLTTGDTGDAGTTEDTRTKKERILDRIEDGNTSLDDAQGVYSFHCRGCHGTDGGGTVNGPALTDRLLDATIDDVVTILLDGGDGMRSYRNILTNKEIADVTVFVFDAYGPE